MTLIGVLSSWDATDTNSAFNLSSSDSWRVISVKLSESWPNSVGVSLIGARRYVRSPSATARIPARRSRIGRLIDRVSQKATIAATITASTSDATDVE